MSKSEIATIKYYIDGVTTWTTWPGAAIAIPAEVTNVLFYVSCTKALYDENSQNFKLAVTSQKAGTDNGIGTIFDHDIYVSGTVFHDLHKLTYNMVDGTLTNAGGLFDNLANSITDLVVSSLPVNSDRCL